MADILPPAPIDAPFGSYNWTDWYQKVRTAINSATSVAWSSVTGTPTTLGGYGISNAVSTNGNQLNSSVTLTNGAGSSVGTLTNAPAAGNPTKWIIINDNGTLRKIPTW